MQSAYSLGAPRTIFCKDVRRVRLRLHSRMAVEGFTVNDDFDNDICAFCGQQIRMTAQSSCPGGDP